MSVRLCIFDIQNHYNACLDVSLSSEMENQQEATKKMSKCHHVKFIVLWPYVLLLQCFWQRHSILAHFDLSVWCSIRSTRHSLEMAEWVCFISSFNESKLTFVVLWMLEIKMLIFHHGSKVLLHCLSLEKAF